MIHEVVFMHGCPHCGDGIPAIVTLIEHAPHDERVEYFGVGPELIEALQQYSSMSIMACKKIENAILEEE